MSLSSESWPSLLSNEYGCLAYPGDFAQQACDRWGQAGLKDRRREVGSVVDGEEAQRGCK